MIIKKNWGIKIARFARVDLFGLNVVDRRFYRRHKTAQQMIDDAGECDINTLRKLIGTKHDVSSGCSESCEPYQTDMEY